MARPYLPHGVPSSSRCIVKPQSGPRQGLSLQGRPIGYRAHKGVLGELVGGRKVGGAARLRWSYLGDVGGARATW